MSFEFFKEHWYIIISSVILIAMVILLIISSKKNINIPKPTKVDSYLSKKSPFITNLYISSSDTKNAINCAPGFSKMLVSDQTQSWNNLNSSGTLNTEGKNPYVYICYKTSTNVNDDTPVLTDIKLNNIGGITDNSYKCCDINGNEICYGNYMDCIGRCCPSGQQCNNGVCQ